MSVNIQLVQELRGLTDAPIQDCKRALELAGDDLQLAVTELAKMGQTGRRTVIPEAGIVAVYADDDRVCLVVAQCETDFVARSPKFVEIAERIAEDIAFGRLSIGASGERDSDPGEEFVRATALFKENCQIGNAVIMGAAGDQLAVYLHHNNQRACVVRYHRDNQVAGYEESNSFAAGKVGAHVVATSPQFVSVANVDQATVVAMEAELREAAIAAGKPPKAVDGMVRGQMKKKLAALGVLSEQPFYADDKISVGDFCKANGIEVLEFEHLTA